MQARTLGNKWLNDLHQEVEKEEKTGRSSSSLMLAPHSWVIFLLPNLFGLAQKSVGETVLPTWYEVSD